MSADPARAMAAARRLTGLLDDPAVGGHLLNVGVALVAALDLGHDGLGGRQRPDGARTWATIPGIARATVEPRLRDRKGLDDFRVRDAIREDRRRYEATLPGWDAACEAPMVRRAGYCGNTRGHNSYPIQDYATGEVRHVVCCSRHRGWGRSVWRDNRAAAPEPDAPRGGAPEPYANAGGHLAEHFPEINWGKLWASLSPRWTAPPERTQPPRPQFELLLGDDEPSDEGDGAPGGLRLIPSGREIAP